MNYMLHDEIKRYEIRIEKNIEKRKRNEQKIDDLEQFKSEFVLTRNRLEDDLIQKKKRLQISTKLEKSMKVLSGYKRISDSFLEGGERVNLINTFEESIYGVNYDIQVIQQKNDDIHADIRYCEQRISELKYTLSKEV